MCCSEVVPADANKRARNDAVWVQENNVPADVERRLVNVVSKYGDCIVKKMRKGPTHGLERPSSLNDCKNLRMDAGLLNGV